MPTQIAAAFVGVGLVVLVWAVQVRLQAVFRALRTAYTPAGPVAAFNPDTANAITWLDCDNCGRRHTPHEDDQDGTATCVHCGADRPVEEGVRDGT